MRLRVFIKREEVRKKYMNIVFGPDFMRQPPAWFHTRILVGAGAFLTREFIHSNRITHVINCAMPYDSPLWFRITFPKQYECLEAIDSLHHNILDWYPKFEETMLRFLREGNGVVYVHCQAGMNRSGFLALTYVCKHFHLDLDQTIYAVRRQRPVILQNLVFMNQVREFINGCIQSEKNTRLDVDRVNDRDSGLSSSNNSARPERLEDNAGEFEDRTRESTVDNLNPILPE